MSRASIKDFALHVTVSGDGTKARFKVGPSEVTTDAAQLDLYIDRLRQLRQAMQPPIAGEPPEGSINVTESPTLKVAAGMMDEAILLALRHPGLGWIHFRFEKSDARNRLLRPLEKALAPEQSQKPSQSH